SRPGASFPPRDPCTAIDTRRDGCARPRYSRRSTRNPMGINVDSARNSLTPRADRAERCIDDETGRPAMSEMHGVIRSEPPIWMPGTEGVPRFRLARPLLEAALVVDRSSVARQLLARALRTHCREIACVGSIAEARDHLDGVSLVVLDATIDGALPWFERWGA